MKVIGCIPARYQSSRLPGKPLCDINGLPMIIHVCQRAAKAKRLDKLVVLTDDERIQATVAEFGFESCLTSVDCLCGTDRIIEYMQNHDGDVFVNIQGDEVLLEPAHIDHLVSALLNDPSAEMATLAHTVSDRETLLNPTTAKVVVNAKQHAMYFSRSCIPLQQSGALPESALVQIGVYAYHRRCLDALHQAAPSPLELIEKLEQLRALHLGLPIAIAEVELSQALSVDTPEDLAKARQVLTAIQPI